ncbi:MAG: hypothetical protein PVH89_05740 [Gammaproteobacteria bacterium]|jgi:hypothetical protein
MDLCHEHNLSAAARRERHFGVRVTIDARDPLQRLLGGNIEHMHWYATRMERDRALADMAAEHLYSRRGDKPTMRFEPVDRS